MSWPGAGSGQCESASSAMPASLVSPAGACGGVAPIDGHLGCSVGKCRGFASAPTETPTDDDVGEVGEIGEVSAVSPGGSGCLPVGSGTEPVGCSGHSPLSPKRAGSCVTAVPVPAEMTLFKKS